MMGMIANLEFVLVSVNAYAYENENLNIRIIYAEGNYQSYQAIVACIQIRNHPFVSDLEYFVSKFPRKT